MSKLSSWILGALLLVVGLSLAACVSDATRNRTPMNEVDRVLQGPS